MKKRKVAILGSTGSIGRQTLQIIRENSKYFDVVSLSCGSSSELLLKQIEEFHPQFASVATPTLAVGVKQSLTSQDPPPIFFGSEGHRKVIEESRPDIVISAMVGSFGLEATFQAAKQEVPLLGLVNKEILVMAGSFLKEALKHSPTQLIPVDSEHSALFQLLQGTKKSQIHSLILTASGGPFLKQDPQYFHEITPEEALKHPNWSMGPKITIDSATLMNKGLEIIEAVHLFDMSQEKIRVVIHPESIVHGLVEFMDGALMAHLSQPDMRLSLAYALFYPERISMGEMKRLDLTQCGLLHFYSPDPQKFPCLKLALEAQALGPQGPVILNAVNDMAVGKFLSRKIRFTEIPLLISDVLNRFQYDTVDSLEEVIALDKEVKSWALHSQNHRLGPQPWGMMMS